MTKNTLCLVLGAVFLAGCGSHESPETGANSETPAQALSAIIRLYEARDFDALIRTRYAEIGKAENEAQIVSLIDRFKTVFQDEAKLNQTIAAYKSVLEISPELSNEGSLVVATFRQDSGFIKLSRMADGKWGFHL